MNQQQLALILAAAALWLLTKESEGASVPLYYPTQWEPWKPDYPTGGGSVPKWVTPAKGQKFEPHFVQAGHQYQLPPGLLSRVARQESNYDPNARSGAGAVGLMQIIPKWHPTVDPTDPVASIYYAASLFRKWFDEFGTWPEALAAYNWGETNVRRKGISPEVLPAETETYIANITRDVGIA